MLTQDEYAKFVDKSDAMEQIIKCILCEAEDFNEVKDEWSKSDDMRLQIMLDKFDTVARMVSKYADKFDI